MRETSGSWVTNGFEMVTMMAGRLRIKREMEHKEEKSERNNVFPFSSKTAILRLGFWFIFLK